MNTPAQNERGWRGSADLWLDAAYQLLVEGGVEAVKVMPLAERLGLSRTSFYWHFADREALLDGLVARWESRNTANLIARTKAPAATIAGMAFANAFLGICYSLAHKLGATYHVPHGLANAALISHVIRYNATDMPFKQAAFPQYQFPQVGCCRAWIWGVSV